MTQNSSLQARGKPSTPTQSDGSSIWPVLRKQGEPASLEQVTVVVLEVETLKLVTPPLSDQQRASLARALFGLGWSVDKLKERARAVALKNTFRSIALDVWVNEGDDVIPRAQFEALVAETNRKTREMVASFQDAVAEEVLVRARQARLLADNLRDPKVAELIAAEDDLRQARLEQAKALKDLEAGKVDRRRRASAWLRSVDDVTRALVMEEALKLGIFETPDSYIQDNLYIFAGELVDLVERLRKEVPS